MLKWTRRTSLVAAILVIGGALIAYAYRGTIESWFGYTALAHTIMVSGNIEAHQSVLAFKTVQSRIVELPFDEGQWVKMAR